MALTQRFAAVTSESYDVSPIVRPYVLAEERRREQAATEATLRGLGVLRDIAELQASVTPTYLGATDPIAMWHCPVKGCHMSAPYPTGHPCPLPASVHEGEGAWWGWRGYHGVRDSRGGRHG